MTNLEEVRESPSKPPVQGTFLRSRAELLATVRRIYGENHATQRRQNAPLLLKPTTSVRALTAAEAGLKEATQQQLRLRVCAVVARRAEMRRQAVAGMRAQYRDATLRWKFAQAERENQLAAAAAAAAAAAQKSLAEGVCDGSSAGSTFSGSGDGGVASATAGTPAGAAAAVAPPVAAASSAPTRRRRRFCSKWAEDGSYMGNRDYWKKWAAVPPDLLAPVQRAQSRYRDTNGLLSSDEVVAELRSCREVELAWTADEVAMFLAKFQQHGKRFKEVAAWLPGKTLPMVVAFYYRIKFASKRFQAIRLEVKQRQQQEFLCGTPFISGGSFDPEAGVAKAPSKSHRSKATSAAPMSPPPTQRVNLDHVFPMLFEGAEDADVAAIRQLQKELWLDMQNRPRTRHQRV